MGLFSKAKDTYNVSDRLKNVRVLENTGRIKEAMAYLYLVYTEIAKKKFGVEKKYS
ncbi:MAG: hypothetical protein GF364_20135, partial [Candidatus Lokiarchaeota archaeon]|nr:hypothetical protein [Candidatus Lokiarchaeota archaeon]